MSSHHPRPVARLLFVCTANQCRSPMAEVLATRHFTEAGCPAEIASAGFLPGGAPVPDEVGKCVGEVGLSLDDHRSQPVTVELLSKADLVVVMTRQHLIDLTGMAPDVWRRCFTLREAVTRGRAAGPRHPDQSVQSWVAAIAGGRRPSDVVNLALGDDVRDPLGGTYRDFVRTREELNRLIAELADLLCPAGHGRSAAV